MKILSVSEAAYIAGFVDGEGSIRVARYTPGRAKHLSIYRPEVVIVNTDLEVMRWLKETVGAGSWFAVRKIKEHHKSCYRLTFSAAAAMELTRQIQPYLRVKRAQADILLRFGPVVKKNIGEDGRQKREELYQLMKPLNRRGISCAS